MTQRIKGERGMEIAAHIVMIILSILAIAPFLLMVSGSLTSDNALIRTGYRFIPPELSTASYQYLFSEASQIGRAYLVTIVVAVTGTFFSLLISSMAAYSLSQKQVPGLKFIFILFLIPMLFNGGIVASYINYTNIFHIKDTIFAYIVPNYLVSVFNIILIRNYIGSSLPDSLLEAAEIDGASMSRIFFTMVLPLSKPILATTGLLTAVAYWNDWVNGLYYINDSSLYTVQVLLDQMNKNVQFLSAHSSNQALGGASASIPTISIRMAIAVVGILPIIILYPFFQNYFKSGITMGAVKG